MNAVPGMNTIIKPVEYAHRPRHTVTDPPGPARSPAPESEPPRPPLRPMARDGVALRIDDGYGHTHADRVPIKL